MNEYIEKEIKVLNVNIERICYLLESLGAKKVYDAPRVRTTFNDRRKTFLQKGLELRITEEDTIKLSLDEKISSSQKNTIKLKISRVQEMQDILDKLDFVPVYLVKSHRISYELGKTDFDIDSFPEIPPFLEIDLENLEIKVEELLNKLELSSHEIFFGGTMDLYKKYGKDYEKLFEIKT